MTCSVISFYYFFDFPDYASFKERLLAAMHQYEIKGTFILAEEGINTTFAGSADNVERLMAVLFQKVSALKTVPRRVTKCDANPFSKAKVKLRREIVTMGVAGLNPAKKTGIHVAPEEWNALISSNDVVLIDTRNDYECILGTFKGAINPKTDHFREFPNYVQTQLLDKKEQKVAMCCTGGVRCEKSTAYLLSLGFEAVYQLDGGILAYLEKVPKEEQLWDGDCFVFDDRVALDASLHDLPKGVLEPEWKNQHLAKKR